MSAPNVKFLDTRGNTTLGVAICDRCHFKFPIGELRPDGNIPGLMVCKEDWDVLDPYRLPPPPPDKWNLPFVRPDVPLINPYGDVPTMVGEEYLTTETQQILLTEDGQGLIGNFDNDLVWPPASNPAFPDRTAPYLAVGPGDPLVTGPGGEEIIT
jgi:hypothetical protein